MTNFGLVFDELVDRASPLATELDLLLRSAIEQFEISSSQIPTAAADIARDLPPCDARPSAATHLLQQAARAHPDLLTALLVGDPGLLVSLTRDHLSALAPWYSSPFSASAALESFAIEHRSRVWHLLAWRGVLRSPISVVRRPEYFKELDREATVRNLLDACPQFWRSDVIR